MKKFLCVIMMLTVLAVLAGCNTPAADTPTQPTGETSTQPTEDAPVLPPTRTAYHISGQPVIQYPLDAAVERAAVIARIRVGDWLGEDTADPVTYFEAEELQCFKGDIADSFILMQHGSSMGIFGGQPIFTHGNELLVFLYKIDKETSAYTYAADNIYGIINGYASVLDVCYDDSGNRYYAYLHCDLFKIEELPTNYVNNQEIFDQICAWAKEDDPFRRCNYSYVFAEEDMIALIERYQ